MGITPSERYHQEQGVRHKTLTDWSRQMLKQVRRWLPQRPIVAVGDSSFAVLELLSAVSQAVNPIHLVSRLRLDAALYAPALPRQPHQMGRTRLKGNRLPSLSQRLNDSTTLWQSLCLSGWYGNTERPVEYTTGTAVWYHSGKPVVPLRWVLVRDPQAQFDPQAFLCTDLNATPADILLWFRQRWQVEVTFAELRAHLGVETQRQWSDLAIERTTPVLFGLFSLVTLFAHYLQAQHPFQLPASAGYAKSLPTFVDALATVRRTLWAARLFPGSLETGTAEKVPPELLEIWCDLLCYVA